MLTYRKATHTNEKKFRGLADDALRARLYVSGWQLSPTLMRIRDEPYINENDTIVLIYDNGTPIGVCVMQHHLAGAKPVSSTFVRKSYRRRGIGTKLINKALGGKRKPFHYGQGLWEAHKFFENFSLASEG